MMIPSLVELFTLLLRAALAAVLVAAGAAKLADTTNFAATLTGLGVPGNRWHLVRSLALAVPLLEFCLGLTIVSGVATTFIDGAVLVLMVAFTGVVLVAIGRAPNLTCRCFGALSDSRFNRGALLRSLLLSAVAALVFWRDTSGSVRVAGSPITILLLLLAYLLFAAAAAQAAKTLATLKAGAPS